MGTTPGFISRLMPLQSYINLEVGPRGFQVDPCKEVSELSSGPHLVGLGEGFPFGPLVYFVHRLLPVDGLQELALQERPYVLGVPVPLPVDVGVDGDGRRLKGDAVDRGEEHLLCWCHQWGVEGPTDGNALGCAE